MRTIEDRLRDAFRADAETVHPEAVRPFASPGARPGRPADRRPRGRIVIPVAAAAAVALIAVGTAVVLPRALSDHGRGHQAPPAGIAAGYPDGQMPGGPPPKFFVAIVSLPGGKFDATELEVVNAATGRITGRITSPGAHRNFQAVAPLGNDKTFVAEASGIRCDAWFYKFTLTAQGRPAGLTPLAVPMVPGRPVGLSSLATSADGQLLAFTTGRCAAIKARQILGHVGVIDLAPRHVTTWSYLVPASPASLSLSANGRLLEMVSNPSGGKPELSIGRNAAWVVRTSAAPGPLAQRYRKLFGPPTWPSAAVLSPTGSLTWALLPTYHRAALHWQVTLAVYQTTTGRLLRSWHIFPRQGYLSDPSLSASVSGRYLLVFGFNDGVEKLDLATGKLTRVPGNNAYLPVDVAW